MGRICFLVCLFLACSGILTEAKYVLYPNGTQVRFYTRVCDPSRFSELGLHIKDFAYCDTSLPYKVRVKDLIDRMTLKEKVLQIGDAADGVPRLGLPSYSWWSEILHGVAHLGQPNRHATFFTKEIPAATSFPMVNVMSATFNASMWKTIGQVASTEARAMHNLGQAGLTFWSPNINLVRDPRWGRALETPGEDPYLAGVYATNFVRGLQDVEGTENTTDLDSRPLKVGACCKHYAAYDVDHWIGTDRKSFNALVTEQDMAETFLKPFEMCVKDGDVASVMCSFNNINGIAPCADARLLKETIRGEWGLHGYIVSDCDSLDIIVNHQKWLNDTGPDAAAQALKAGLDLDCGWIINYYEVNADAAVLQGKAKESEIDNALKNLFITLMRLGFFDGSPQYEKLNQKDVCTKENIELATETAREGIVVLKNDKDTLPLNAHNIKTIALVGPHANATKVMVGNYEGYPCQYRSPIDGFSSFGEVVYAEGCADVACADDGLIPTAVEASKKADATVVIVGLSLSFEREELDRVDLLLPGKQTELINRVAAVSKGPVILVIMSGGCIDVSFAKNNSKIQAIIWAGYPGEEGGQALADIVFGKHNPGGRLPLTWYENSYVDMLPLTSMKMRPIDSLGYPGRTYKFYNGSVVYPFGHGLSYTKFNYNFASVGKSFSVKLNKLQHCRNLIYTEGSKEPPCPAILIDDLECDKIKNIEFKVEVKNVGKTDGRESVLVYWIAPKGIADAPIKQLVAFDKVFVPAGGSEKVKFSMNVCKSFGLVDYKANNVLASGEHTIVVGDGKNAVSFPFQVTFQH